MTRKTIALVAGAALLLVAGQARAVDLTFEFLRIVKSGDTAPGTGGTFDGTFSDPSVDNFGNVAFHADVDTSTGGTEGTYAFLNGTLVRIMDELNPVPGTTTTIDGLDDHVEISGGLVAFYGDTYPNSATNALGVSDGSTARIVFEEGVTLLPSAGNPVITGSEDSEGFGTDGTRVAFQAHFATGQGVYLDDGTGSLSLIADTNGAAPVSGSAFTWFEDAMPDAAGPGIVFRAQAGGSWGVYLSTNGVLTRVYDQATDFPAITPGITWIEPGRPDIDAGQVAFGRGQWDSSSPDPVVAEVVLFDGAGLEVIADLNTVLPTGVTPTRFGYVGIANGAVAFVAQTSLGQSVLVWHDGVLHEVLSVNDTLDGLTVTNIDSYKRPFLADGFMAIQVDLSDGSTAIYRVTLVPEPASLALMGLGGLLLAGRRRKSRIRGGGLASSV